MLFWKYKCRSQELHFLKEIKISLQNQKITVPSRNLKLKWARPKSQMNFWNENQTIHNRRSYLIWTVHTTRYSKALLKWKELEDAWNYMMDSLPVTPLSSAYTEYFLSGENASKLKCNPCYIFSHQLELWVCVDTLKPKHKCVYFLLWVRDCNFQKEPVKKIIEYECTMLYEYILLCSFPYWQWKQNTEDMLVVINYCFNYMHISRLWHLQDFPWQLHSSLKGQTRKNKKTLADNHDYTTQLMTKLSN